MHEFNGDPCQEGPRVLSISSSVSYSHPNASLSVWTFVHVGLLLKALSMEVFYDGAIL